jgi:hypothetical protein
MSGRIPIADAAVRLKMTYQQVRSLVLRRELKGGRDQFGHWYVDAASVTRFLRRQPRRRP